MKNLYLLLPLLCLIISSCTKDGDLSPVEATTTTTETFSSLKYVSTSNLSAPRYLPEAAVIGSKIYFGPGADESISGLEIVDVYDTLSKTWNILKLPKKMMGPYLTSYGSKLFVCGGFTGNLNAVPTVYTTIEMYDTVTRIWTSFPFKYYHHNSGETTIGRYIFIAGGQHGIIGLENSRVEVFDMETLTYLPDMKLTIPRVFPYTYAIKNKAYFLWGSDPTFGWKSSIRMDIYDVETKKWDSTDVSKPNDQYVMTYNPDGIIGGNKLIFTGNPSGANPITDTIYFYNVESGSWSSMKNVRPVSGQQILVAGNLMILAGGITTPYTNDSYQYVDIYDLSKNTWQSIKLPYPRTSINLMRVGNKIYIAGGSHLYKLSTVVDILELVP